MLGCPTLVSRPPCTRSTRECDFWNWGEGALRPACCTEHLLDLTTFIDEQLSRHGLVHWLDYGSLLGAVRAGELIPWDGDVDFGMLESDRAAVMGLAAEVEAAGHRLDDSHPGLIRVLFSSVNSLHVDLFLWTASDGVLHPQDDPEFAWPGMAERRAFPRGYIDDLGEVSLRGRTFPAPAPADEFLREHRYGPDWATPAPAILSVRLYPDFDVDEATPDVRRLLSQIASGDARLAELRSASRWSHVRGVELLQKAGLPISPRARYLDAAAQGIAAGQDTPTVRTLVASAALLDQAIDEYQSPSPMLSLRRTGRRARRIGEVLAARLQRRPHRAGFPFGVESAEHG